MVKRDSSVAPHAPRPSQQAPLTSAHTLSLYEYSAAAAPGSDEGVPVSRGRCSRNKCISRFRQNPISLQPRQS